MMIVFLVISCTAAIGWVLSAAIDDGPLADVFRHLGFFLRSCGFRRLGFRGFLGVLGVVCALGVIYVLGVLRDVLVGVVIGGSVVAIGVFLVIGVFVVIVEVGERRRARLPEHLRAVSSLAPNTLRWVGGLLPGNEGAAWLIEVTSCLAETFDKRARRRYLRSYWRRVPQLIWTSWALYLGGSQSRELS